MRIIDHLAVGLRNLIWREIWTSRLELFWLAFGAVYEATARIHQIHAGKARDALSAFFILLGGFLVLLMLTHLALRPQRAASEKERDGALLMIAFAIACLGIATSTEFDDLVGAAIALAWAAAIGSLLWRKKTIGIREMAPTFLPMLLASWVSGLLAFVASLPIEVPCTAKQIIVVGFLGMAAGWRYRDELAIGGARRSNVARDRVFWVPITVAVSLLCCVTNESARLVESARSMDSSHRAPLVVVPGGNEWIINFATVTCFAIGIVKAFPFYSSRRRVFVTWLAGAGAVAGGVGLVTAHVTGQEARPSVILGDMLTGVFLAVGFLAARRITRILVTGRLGG